MDVVTIISSLGFPIAACIFVAIYVMKMTDNYRQDIKEMQADHREEIEKLTESINRLCDKIDNFLKGGTGE